MPELNELLFAYALLELASGRDLSIFVCQSWGKRLVWENTDVDECVSISLWDTMVSLNFLLVSAEVRVV